MKGRANQLQTGSKSTAALPQKMNFRKKPGSQVCSLGDLAQLDLLSVGWNFDVPFQSLSDCLRQAVCSLRLAMNDEGSLRRPFEPLQPAQYLRLISMRGKSVNRSDFCAHGNHLSKHPYFF